MYTKGIGSHIQQTINSKLFLGSGIMSINFLIKNFKKINNK